MMMEGTNAMCQMLMLQEEINKNQKGGNNNRDSGLFGLDVPPKPEVVKCFRSYLLSRDDDDDDGDDGDYYRHDDDFGDYEQNLSLSSQLRNQCLRVLGSVVRFGAPTTREVRLGEKSKTANGKLNLDVIFVLLPARSTCAALSRGGRSCTWAARARLHWEDPLAPRPKGFLS